MNMIRKPCIERMIDTLEISPTGDFATINRMVNGKSTKQGEFLRKKQIWF